MKALSNFFGPLYKKLEKDRKAAFERSLLEYLKEQSVRNTWVSNAFEHSVRDDPFVSYIE